MLSPRCVEELELERLARVAERLRDALVTTRLGRMTPIGCQERWRATMPAAREQTRAAPTTWGGEDPATLRLGSMNQLAHLTHLALDDLPLAHRLALAAGAGVWLTGEDERISTAHELVALAVPALVRLRTTALLADADPEPVAGESELALESAGALRLLDRALAVHGRDHGYLTDAWCQHAHVAAHLARLRRSGPRSATHGDRP